MADLADSTVLINDVETAQNAPVSEATIQKVGGGINGALNRLDAIEAKAAPGLLTTGTTVFNNANSGTQTAISNFTFTGRPVMIVLYGGTIANNNTSGTNTFTVSTTSDTLATASLTSPLESRAFASAPVVYFLASHPAGTYSIRYTGTTGGLRTITVTSVSIAIIEL